MSYDLILRGGSVMTTTGCEIADIAVTQGRIAGLGGDRDDANRIIDCAGLHVLPGVIDTQVHFREPGREWKENLESGSRAAALGGVTGVFEMPNTEPPTTTPDLFADKLERAARMHVDHAFYAGASTDNADMLPIMEAMDGCCGVKVFMGESTGSLLVDDDKGIETVLRSVTRRCAFHCEDNARLIARRHLAVPGDVSSHARTRDEQSALLATRRLLAIAERLGKPVHVLHVSSAAEMEFLGRARGGFSVETTPQHLTFSAPDIYERLGTLAQMNPPIRSKRHTEALWRGVRDGVVDVIGSDHAPHTLEEKSASYPASPSGMPGVQTLVPVMLTHVAEGRLSLQRFVDLTSAGPQRLFGMVGKGRIALGYDADFTVVDLKARREITADAQATRVGWTPFDGFVATGWPVMTVIRGQVVMREDQMTSVHRGVPMRFAHHRVAD